LPFEDKFWVVKIDAFMSFILINLRFVHENDAALACVPVPKLLRATVWTDGFFVKKNSFFNMHPIYTPL